MSNQKPAWVALLQGRRSNRHFWRKDEDMDLYKIVSTMHIVGLRGFWNFDRRYRPAYVKAWQWSINPEGVVNYLGRLYESKRVTGTDTFRLSQSDVEEIRRILGPKKGAPKSPWHQQIEQKRPFLNAFLMLLSAVALYGACSIPPECRMEGGEPWGKGGEWVCD